jgi:hypothetical protein
MDIAVVLFARVLTGEVYPPNRSLNYMQKINREIRIVFVYCQWSSEDK